MARFANSVLFNPASNGTVDFVVSAAVTGYMTPALAGMPSGVYKYRAESSDLTQWEIGEGTYTSGTTTLTRTTVLYNSAGSGTASGQSGAGTKISFTAPPNVGVVQMVEDTLCPDQSTSWTYLQKAQARANIDALKKNYILNGAMMVSQEFGSTPLTVNGSYPVDMFAVNFVNSGTQTFAQIASNTPGGSPNRLRVTATVADASVAAGDYCLIQYNNEGYRVADLLLGTASAKTITITFGVKAPAGTYCITLRNGTATRSYLATYVISGGEANTDVRKSVTVALDQTGTWANTNTLGISVSWCLMAGTTFQSTANTWQNGNFLGTSSQFNFMGTAGQVFELFDVGMYEGDAAPEFQVPDYVSEYRLCQRYWAVLDVPIIGYDARASGITNWFNIHYPTAPMRIAPVVTLLTAPTAIGSTYALGVSQVGTMSLRADVTSTGIGSAYIQNGAWKLNARM